MDNRLEETHRTLQQLLEQNSNGWLIWEGNGFLLSEKKPFHKPSNRETLAHFFEAGVYHAERKGEDGNIFVRTLWIEEIPPHRPKGLPRIIGEDGFLYMYSLGQPLSIDLAKRIWKRLDTSLKKEIDLSPIEVGWNRDAPLFFDVDATPPGFLSKVSTYFRLKKDQQQIEQVESDLQQVSQIEDASKRKWLTLAILSHGAAYRELEEKEILIPSFQEKGKLIPYRCIRHLIAEGVKTVSLVPIHSDAPPIYLCQGTELWPSQPSFLGSILANFARHGAASEAYAHSWRRIHKHLRDLKPYSHTPFPIVTGHSMGGSLAMQIALYSHDLIDQAYAFNPPMPNERDYSFYQELSPELQAKFNVSANLDDFVFWRIGAKVVGNVILFLGKDRWRYTPIGLWDFVFILPALFKFILNVRRAFPAHQKIVPLQESYLSIKLSPSEIEKENLERIKRFDYMRFFPKLYDPTKTFLLWMRKIFGWSLEIEYIENEIEIIALHERDLIDTLTSENREEIERELEELKRQKTLLLKQLRRLERKKAPPNP